MDVRIAKAPPTLLTEIPTNKWTEPFWQATREHELRFPHCGECGRFRMPPSPFCPHCRSQKLHWAAISPHGVLYSYTIVERTVLPDVEIDLPYVPAIVEFPQADGVRLITNIVGSRLCDIIVGCPVRLCWHSTVGGGALPVFSMAVKNTLEI